MQPGSLRCSRTSVLYCWSWESIAPTCDRAVPVEFTFESWYLSSLVRFLAVKKKEYVRGILNINNTTKFGGVSIQGKWELGVV